MARPSRGAETPSAAATSAAARGAPGVPAGSPPRRGPRVADPTGTAGAATASRPGHQSADPATPRSPPTGGSAAPPRPRTPPGPASPPPPPTARPGRPGARSPDRNPGGRTCRGGGAASRAGVPEALRQRGLQGHQRPARLSMARHLIEGARAIERHGVRAGGVPVDQDRASPADREGGPARVGRKRPLGEQRRVAADPHGDVTEPDADRLQQEGAATQGARRQPAVQGFRRRIEVGVADPLRAPVPHPLRPIRAEWRIPDLSAPGQANACQLPIFDTDRASIQSRDAASRCGVAAGSVSRRRVGHARTAAAH